MNANKIIFPQIIVSVFIQSILPPKHTFQMSRGQWQWYTEMDLNKNQTCTVHFKPSPFLTKIYEHLLVKNIFLNFENKTKNQDMQIMLKRCISCETLSSLTIGTGTLILAIYKLICKAI